jgi:hypothetical protein
MRTRLVRRPGAPGTKRLVAKYGSQLICVRYRYDADKQKRYKTVELIIETVAWVPPEQRLVAVKVALSEEGLRRAVKAAGGVWSRTRQVWELRYDQAAALNLLDRIVDDLL